MSSQISPFPLLVLPPPGKNAPVKTVSQKVSTKGSAAQSRACFQPSSCMRPAFLDLRLSSPAFWQRPILGLLALACPHQPQHLSSVPLERCCFLLSSSLGLKWRRSGNCRGMNLPTHNASSTATLRALVALTAHGC